MDNKIVDVADNPYQKLGEILHKKYSRIRVTPTDLHNAEKEFNEILKNENVTVKCVSLVDRIQVQIRNNDTGEMISLKPVDGGLFS